MGAQLCKANASFEEVEMEIRNIVDIQKLFSRYPILGERFKIRKQYFSEPSFSGVVNFNNGILFKCTSAQTDDNISNLSFQGLVFEENIQNNNQTNSINNSFVNYKAWIFQGGILSNSTNHPKTGKGMIIFDNGDEYQGQFKNNEFHGVGKHHIQNQNLTYQGSWVIGKRQGQGRLSTINEPSKILQSNSPKSTINTFSYSGQFQNDQINGAGQIIYPHARYSGSLKNNLQHGYGIYETTNMKYTGQWSEGLMNGSGKCCWYNDVQKKHLSSIYQGQYKMGKKHGFGEYRIIDLIKGNDKIYRGQWIEGKLSYNSHTNLVK